MNRLILVGNGFDLAHGLKTSYKDFIQWYLDQCFINAGIYANGDFYEDEFLHITVVEHHKLMMLRALSGGKGLSKFLFEQGLLKYYLSFESGRQYASQSNIEKYGYVSEITAHNVSYKSMFFKKLINTCQDCDWVDIENEYFDQLKACKTKENSFDKEKVKQLNSEFDYLKLKLEEYLCEQQDGTQVQIIPEILTAIKADFNVADFDALMSTFEARKKIGKGTTKGEKLIHDLYFLNFNYIKILNGYRTELKREMGRFDRVEINHIHGELNNPTNPIIFGFGDEHDKHYLEFQEDRNNELFDHIKSYQYLRTPNYRKLLRFLNSDDYQVFVMGHSCGLSDRTMFKEIFEHQNCKSIRLFHYNNDFHDKTINVSKHFSNKGHMRKLIVDYKASDVFPQDTADLET